MLLEDLMKEFLHNCDKKLYPDSVEDFIAENLDMDIEEFCDDLKDYNDTLDKLLDDTVRDGSKLLDKQNRPSLLAMMIYSYKEDLDLDDWFSEYVKKNNVYIIDQKQNFLHMKNDFEKYIKRV